MVRVFAKGTRDRCLIPGRVIPKTQKLVLGASLLNTQHYKVRIKSKWSNPRKGIVLYPTPRCSSYCKGSLRVAFDKGLSTNLYIYTERKKIDTKQAWLYRSCVKNLDKTRWRLILWKACSTSKWDYVSPRVKNLGKNHKCFSSSRS